MNKSQTLKACDASDMNRPSKASWRTGGLRLFLTSTALCTGLAVPSLAQAQTTPPPASDAAPPPASDAPAPASTVPLPEGDAEGTPLKPTAAFVEQQSLGQVGGDGVPSVYQTVDENGVDLTDGSFNLAITEGTIGAGKGALSLMRYIGVGGVKDNVSSSFRRSVSGGVVTIDIMSGNRREVFTGAPGDTTFTSKQGTGATLTKVTASSYRYTAGDGSVTMYGPPRDLTEFESNGFCGSSTSATSCSLVALSTVEPDGATTTFNWDAGQNCRPGPLDGSGEPTYICAQFWRQRGISNNFGYALRFSFQQEANPTSGGAPYTWYTRSGAALSSGTATRSVSYSTPAPGVTQITTDGGKLWQLTNGGGGYLLTKVDPPGGPAIDITRDANGAVSSVTKNGVTTNYTKYFGGTMTKTVPGRGTTTIISDLNLGRPTSVRDPLNQVTNFAYDGSGRLTRTTAPEGNAALYDYDGRGNLWRTQEIAKPGSGVATITTTSSFPQACASQVTCNKPTSTTDARGAVTDYAWDPTHGGLLTVTAPAGANGVRPQTRLGYAQAAVAGQSPVWLPVTTSTCNTVSSCAGAADETRTTIGYEGTHLLPVSMTVAAGDGSVSSTTTVGYDGTGNVVSTDGPLAGPVDTTEFGYNSDRQRASIVGPDPDGAGPRGRMTVDTRYDAAGRVTSEMVGYLVSGEVPGYPTTVVGQTSQNTYDAYGRLVQQTLSGSDGGTVSLTQYSYTADNLVECAATRMNPAAYGGLPGACSLSAQGAAGPDRVTQNAYDALGRVITLRTAVGTADQADEMTTSYTPNGQQAWVQDGKGNRTSYSYDGLDRVVGMSMPHPSAPGVSSGTDFENYAYDASGNLTSQRLRDGIVVSYAFDALNRMVQRSTSSGEAALTYNYDNFGRLTQTNGGFLRFGYDALGRKTMEYMLGHYKLSTYDAAGRRTRLTWHADGVFFDYDYSVTGEMTAVREMGATSGVGVLAQYTYDDLGRRTSLVRGNGTVTAYAFDPASRLSALHQAGPPDNYTTFAYNPASEIVQRSQSNSAYSWTGHVNVNRPYSVNGLNQFTVAGPATFTYDARGNLTSDGTRGFAYNSRNLLTASNAGGYEYDELGRLFNVGPEALVMTYDGAEMVGEHAYGTAAVLRRYVYGPGVDEPIVWYEGPGLADRRFYHADERGSIVALTNSAGQLIQRLTYDEYGIPGDTNNLIPGGAVSRFQYTGQKWIPSLGMYDYKARTYSPTLGRFLQTDPIGYGDGMNLYNYVGGDPVNFVDPSGLEEENVIVVVGRRLKKKDGGGGGGEIVVRGSRGGGFTGAGGGSGRGYGTGIPNPFDPAAGESDGPEIVVTANKTDPPKSVRKTVENIITVIGRNIFGPFDTVIDLINIDPAHAPSPLYNLLIDDEHVKPHLKEFRHPKDQVYKRVFNYLNPLRGHTQREVGFRGQVRINSTIYRFHGYTFKNGDITVGTIYVPR